MNRRAFGGRLTLAVLAAPRIARAQSARKVYRIGVLGLSPTTAAMVGPEPQNAFVGALVGGLRSLGYVYGEHFVTEPRGAEGKAERYPILVAELLRLQVDVIVGVAASVPVLKSATSTIPIVMPGFDDPVGEGIVQSLARPGGNITGMTFQSVELTGKQLELLREVVPKGTVAILRDQSSTGFSAWRAAQTAALARAWRLLPLEVREAGELDAAFQAATRAKAAALLVLGGPLLDPQFRRVTDLASRGLLPSMHRFRYQVEAGGLMSYGPDLVDLWRQAATFVNKILKGANPADLPVEQPTKLELVINMKTAAALGVAIPQSVLLRADRVLQ